MCARSCTTNHWHSKKIGNLSNHALSKHMGKTYFMNLSTTTGFYMDCPYLIYFEQLYYNQYGERTFLKFSLYDVKQKVH